MGSHESHENPRGLWSRFARYAFSMDRIARYVFSMDRILTKYSQDVVHIFGDLSIPTACIGLIIFMFFFWEPLKVPKNIVNKKPPVMITMPRSCEKERVIPQDTA